MLLVSLLLASRHFNTHTHTHCVSTWSASAWDLLSISQSVCFFTVFTAIWPTARYKGIMKDRKRNRKKWLCLTYKCEKKNHSASVTLVTVCDLFFSDWAAVRAKWRPLWTERGNASCEGPFWKCEKECVDLSQRALCSLMHRRAGRAMEGVGAAFWNDLSVTKYKILRLRLYTALLLAD